MTVRRPESPSSAFRTALARACDRLSHAGVWLLPLFYMGFCATLFALWCAPHRALWPAAAALTLTGMMGVAAVVFHLASRLAPAGRRGPSPAPLRSSVRVMPLRFVQMRTRPCSQVCGESDRVRTRFMVSCFHANCAAATAEANAEQS